MGRSDFLTLLPLDTYARTMQIRGYHFNQISGTLAPTSGDCDIWIQSERDALAQAIATAESMLAEYLGFYVAPNYRANERITVGQYFGTGQPFEFGPRQTQFGQVQSFGVRATTLIEAGATVTYAAATGNPITDTATISVNVTGSGVTNANQVRVFYRTADGAPAVADERWEIRPLRVSLSGATATITGYRYQFVDPVDIWQTEREIEPPYAKIGGDVSTAGHFVTAVDVYRVYTNQQLPVDLLWDTLIDDCADCESPEADTAQDAVARIINQRTGLVLLRPATYNSTTGLHEYESPSFASAPRHAILNYLSGASLDSLGNMEPQLLQAVVRLTNVLLPTPPCDYCGPSIQIWKRDREIPEPLSSYDVNPFGPQRGAIFSWNVVRAKRIGQGGKVTAR